MMKYWIWSNEHHAWWGLNHRGYVSALNEAGIYGADEAAAILADANIVQMHLQWFERDEVAVPVVEWLAAQERRS